MGAKRTEETLQITIPSSVKKQLSIRAAHEGGTIRSVVLKALRDSGLKVKDAELVDRRRIR
tara:strand:+ start:11435 stop:11617 length:183 start_codon:yes stop_codon:yes gene_type:complete